jgi:hypothetical protein
MQVFSSLRDLHDFSFFFSFFFLRDLAKCYSGRVEAAQPFFRSELPGDVSTIEDLYLLASHRNKKDHFSFTMTTH